MIKHFCDRCKKETSVYHKVIGKVITPMSEDGRRPYITDEWEFELCEGCLNRLDDFFNPKPCMRLSHGELVQMQKAKENKDED